MILSKSNKINYVLGSRFIKINPYLSIWNFGNYIFKELFNFLHKSKINDVLCCAKSFYKSDLPIEDIKSKGFDIDVELTSILFQKFNKSIIIPIHYTRRNINEGKKITITDGFKIFKRIIIRKNFY